ncbi:HTH-type transcriptional regulator MhqR [Aquisphaera giovannonii]|uniref:HTH-type transcriptional regulator MhqR n=1 Tax=Aquisphaera giovannonii TaxID=406548 RepID=A0A5B9W2Q3_9BACT|nr:MarR family transcriptional regulator [Aquisphaera giovannonii]QEH34507.1 HTH-type transcriptional regulator MhqR [Aquisphaera giovannonii]
MSNSRLQRELRKRNPFESAEQEASLSIARTADRFGICFARLFREYGLTPSQYNVLRILRGEGNPLPILEVADRMLAAVPGITGLIDRLEGMGLVARDRSAEDRRVVFVAIRPKGLDLLRQLDEPVSALHGRLLGHMSPEELRQLIGLLEKARQPLDDSAGA